MDAVLAKRIVRQWIKDERVYAESKWSDEAPVLAGNTAHDWATWIEQYLTRAFTLGLDTERGRVALGKAIVTATRLLEQAVREHGHMPRGGVPS